MNLLAFAKKLHKEPPTTRRFQRFLLSFPFGFGFGMFLWWATLGQAKMVIPSDNLQMALQWLFVLGVAAMYSWTARARAICCLLLPQILGRDGQVLMQTVITDVLFRGPLQNLADNGRQIGETIACNADLAASVIRERMNLHFKPLKASLHDIAFGASESNKYEATNQNVLKQLLDQINLTQAEQLSEQISKGSLELIEWQQRRQARREYENVGGQREDVWDRLKKNTTNSFLSTIDTSCDKIYAQAYERCTDTAIEVYEKCVDLFKRMLFKHVYEQMCMFFTSRKMCRKLREYQRQNAECNNTSSIDEMKEMFKNAIDAAFDSTRWAALQFHVSIKFLPQFQPRIASLFSLEGLKAKIANHFKTEMSKLGWFSIIFKFIYAFLMGRGLLAVNGYMTKFTKDVKFDNKYLTGYYDHIEAQRRKEKRKVLGQLKQFERKKVVRLTSLKPTKEERGRIIGGVGKLLAFVMLVALISWLDAELATLLESVEKHQHWEGYQVGVHWIAVDVKGEGFMADTIRRIVNSFNHSYTVSQVLENKVCHLRVFKTRQTSVVYIVAALLAMLCIIILQGYVLRLRPVVAGFFYRRRQKARILALYNEMLYERAKFEYYAEQRIEHLVRKQMRECPFGVLEMVSKEPGRLGRLLQPLIKVKCLICEEKDAKKKMIQCGNDECPYFYCAQCWRAQKKKCCACAIASRLVEPDDDETDSDSQDVEDKQPDLAGQPSVLSSVNATAGKPGGSTAAPTKNASNA